MKKKTDFIIGMLFATATIVFIVLFLAMVVLRLGIQGTITY